MVTKPSTAFVLAGGGSLGAVQVGMLKALAQAKVIPDLVVGASVGAVNGAYVAGEPGINGVGRLERIWAALSRRAVFPFSPMRAAVALLGWSNHFIPVRPLRRLIESELPFRNLEDASIRCLVITTDALSGQMVALDSGPASEALLASTAIPAIFPPQQVGGHMLVDGGVTNNTPIAAAIDAGAGRIIVLPTGMACAAEELPRAAFGMGLNALNLIVMRQLVDDMQRYSDRVEIVTIPPLCPMSVTPYDFSQSTTLIERAYAATRKWLRNHGLRPDKPPTALHPHNH